MTAATATTFHVSAPGKVILFGEHAVVYGKTAIAASLGLRTDLHIRVTDNQSKIILRLPDVGLPVVHFDAQTTLDALNAYARGPATAQELLAHNARATVDGALLKFIQDRVVRDAQGDANGVATMTSLDVRCGSPGHQALLAFWYVYAAILAETTAKGNSSLSSASLSSSSSRSSFDMSVRSRLPVGAGLGSSASYCVCVAAGLAWMLGDVPAPDESSPKDSETTKSTLLWQSSALDRINAWAFLGERVIHGNPSGIDNSARRANADGARVGRESYLHIVISHYPSLPSFNRLRFLLTNTRVPRDTKKQVALVHSYHDEFPAVVDPIFTAIEAIAEQFMQMFTGENGASNSDAARVVQAKLERLIPLNHHLITALGVGHPALDRITAITAQHNLHSKLTGAGGGGCALTLLPEGVDAAPVKLELEQEGFECFEVDIGGRGVCGHGGDVDVE